MYFGSCGYEGWRGFRSTLLEYLVVLLWALLRWDSVKFQPTAMLFAWISYCNRLKINLVVGTQRVNFRIGELPFNWQSVSYHCKLDQLVQ